jgi:hypothetical protein
VNISRFMSHQSLCPSLGVKLLETMLRNRCWPTTFYTINVGDADGCASSGRCDQPLSYNKWLEICAIIFRDGVEETTRNANCFVILFLANKYLHFRKEASKLNPLLV